MKIEIKLKYLILKVHIFIYVYIYIKKFIRYKISYQQHFHYNEFFNIKFIVNTRKKRKRLEFRSKCIKNQRFILNKKINK